MALVALVALVVLPRSPGRGRGGGGARLRLLLPRPTRPPSATSLDVLDWRIDYKVLGVLALGVWLVALTLAGSYRDPISRGGPPGVPGSRGHGLAAHGGRRHRLVRRPRPGVAPARRGLLPQPGGGLPFHPLAAAPAGLAAAAQGLRPEPAHPRRRRGLGGEVRRAPLPGPQPRLPGRRGVRAWRFAEGRDASCAPRTACTRSWAARRGWWKRPSACRWTRWRSSGRLVSRKPACSRSPGSSSDATSTCWSRPTSSTWPGPASGSPRSPACRSCTSPSPASAGRAGG